jgi:hypothetical protein
MVQHGLDQVADGHGADQHGDHRLQWPEAVALQAEDQKGDYGGQQPGQPQRDAQQQVKSQRGPQKLGQVGRHRHDFHEHPHAQDDAPGKVRPALLGQIQTRRNPQFGR